MSDEAHRLGTHQEISAYFGLTKPTDVEHLRINEILRYWDIYRYVLREENIRTCGGKQKLQDIMEPMLPHI